MSRTIKAIERHMIPRSGRLRPKATARQAVQPMQNGERKLVTEWQQRGPETFSGIYAEKTAFGIRACATTRTCGRQVLGDTNHESRSN